MNRRDWMLTVGEVAAGLGISNLAPAETRSEPSLPPGLYLPSNEHLGHALANPLMNPLATPGQSQSGPPQFFSQPEFAVITRITELILGEEQGSPLAKDAAAWIDLYVFSSAGVRTAAVNLDPPHRALALAYYGADSVHQLESSDPQKICRAGLAWLAEQGDFLALDPHGQIALLDSISDTRPQAQSQNAGTRFFRFMKSETIRGFYTSRTGLKELDYKGNSFYASSPGCSPASK